MDIRKKSINIGSIAIAALNVVYYLFVLFVFPHFSLPKTTYKILSYLIMYGPGTWIVWHLVRKLPQEEWERESFSPKMIFFLFMLQSFSYVLLFIMMQIEIHIFKIGPLVQDIQIEGWLDYLALLFLAPFFEELVYRKILGDKMLPHSESEYIVLSALLFGLAHMPGNNWKIVITTFYAGFIYAWIYAKTRSLSLVVILHTLFNVFGGILPHLLAKYVTDLAEGISVLIVMTLGIIAVGLLIHNRQKINIAGENRLLIKESWKEVLSSPGFWVYVIVLVCIFFLRKMIFNL